MEAGTHQAGDLRFSIHTADSWARAVAEAALDMAAKDSSFGNSPVTVDAKIVVTQMNSLVASEPGFCGVCIRVGDREVCFGVMAH